MNDAYSLSIPLKVGFFVAAFIAVLGFRWLVSFVFIRVFKKCYAKRFNKEIEQNMVLLDSYLNDKSLQQDISETEYEYSQRMHAHYSRIISAIDCIVPELKGLNYWTYKFSLIAIGLKLSRDIRTFYSNLSYYNRQLKRISSMDVDHNVADFASQVKAIIESRELLLEQGQLLLEELAKV